MMKSTDWKMILKGLKTNTKNLNMLIRPRRNRATNTIREMIKETVLRPENFIYPLFLVDGENIKIEVKSLPGNYRWSIDLLLPEINNCIDLGIKSFVSTQAISTILWPSWKESPVVSVSRKISYIIRLYLKVFFLKPIKIYY